MAMWQVYHKRCATAKPSAIAEALLRRFERPIANASTNLTRVSVMCNFRSSAA
jgi:hypothetical protein